MEQIEQPGTVSFGFRCEQGHHRPENQDALGHFTSPRGEVFVLADGMGGHKGGSVASQLAVAGFERHFLAQAQLPVPEALAEAARLVNAEIFARGHSGEAETEGMGSTLVAALLRGDLLTVGHIGDSRCYLYREGKLRLLTRDHSAVQFMVDAGVLTPEQARNHPNSSVLTRALGQQAEIEMEFAEPITISASDILLICSDGLHGYVEHSEIEDKLQVPGSSQGAADALIALALAAGGRDNVSVWVIRGSPAIPAVRVPVPVPVKVPQPTKKAAEHRQISPWFLGVAATVLALATGAGVALYQRSRPVAPAARAHQASRGPAPAQTTQPLAASVAAPVEAAAVLSTPVPSIPVPRTPTVKVRVVIIYPSDAGKRQIQPILDTEKILAADGFVASHNRKLVRDGLVWRMVLPRNAVTAPPRPLIAAVYLPGYRDDATRICQLAHCSPEAPAPVDDRDLSMFKENFPRRGVVLFMHPGRVGK